MSTDASLATADEHILAVGDIAYASNTASGRRTRVEHWGDGYDDDRVVGDGDAWSVWYGKKAALCGVLAVGDDDAYERGQRQLEQQTPFADAG